MSIAKQKQSLPISLRKINLRLNSLFFQRLFLLEQQQHDYKHVRHYDLQCEGIQILADFFRSKQQNILFKGFAAIVRSLNADQEKAIQGKSKENGTTHRTFINTTFTASESSPIKQHLCHTIRSMHTQKNSSLHGKSECNKTATNLELLLNRVKLANSSNQPIYSFREHSKSSIAYDPTEKQRQSYSTYAMNKYRTPKTAQQEQRFKTNTSNLDPREVNYYDYYKSQMTSNRNSRRQFIMDKFSLIQNQLHALNDKRQVKKPQMNKQILTQINSIKQRLKL